MDQPWSGPDQELCDRLNRRDAEQVGAQGLYNALMAWAVDYAAVNITERKDRLRKEREHGHGDMLIRAAMIAFGQEQDAAEQRVADDRMADRC